MSEELKPVAFPPLPKGYVTLDGLTRYDAMQVHQYALRYADAVVAAQSRQAAQPVATITECEACFTPDVCRLRGKCDHYSAEQVRVAAQPQQAAPSELLRLFDLYATNLLQGANAQAASTRDSFRALLAEAQPQQTADAPVEFDHAIGADRYKVVKGSFWWHIRIGGGTANVGKFHTKLAAEDMALKLLTAFRDGAFLQSKAAQPQQASQPVAWLVIDEDRMPVYAAPWKEAAHEHINDAINEHDIAEARNWKVLPAYAHPPAAQPQQAAPCDEEIGWLIEHRAAEHTLWWSGEFCSADGEYRSARLIAKMSNDANNAVRFARKEDAQRVLDAMLAARPSPILARALELYSVTEHMWTAAAQPQQAEPACPRCLGSGETTVLSGGGPDAYDVAINCDACGGTGAVPPQQTAKQQFDAFGGADEPDPVARLRFFCSLAMSGQDWLDVEPFFDAVYAARAAQSAVLMRGVSVLTDDEIVTALKSCEQEDHAQAGWVWRQRVKWCRAIEAAVIAKLGGAA